MSFIVIFRRFIWNFSVLKTSIKIPVYKNSCPSLKVKELVIDPKELAYPVNTPRERTLYNVCDLLSAIKEGRPFLVNDKWHKELKEILPDESLSDISNLSLLGGPDIKVRINTHKLFDTLIQALIMERSYLKTNFISYQTTSVFVIIVGCHCVAFTTNNIYMYLYIC